MCKVQDWVTHGSEEKIKQKGKMELKGRDYEMQENDVVFFHHSAK